MKKIFFAVLILSALGLSACTAKEYTWRIEDVDTGAFFYDPTSFVGSTEGGTVTDSNGEHPVTNWSLTVSNGKSVTAISGDGSETFLIDMADNFGSSRVHKVGTAGMTIMDHGFTVVP